MRTHLVAAARGDAPLDLVLRGGRLLNVYTGETSAADIGIAGSRVAVVDWGGEGGLTGAETIDARGLLAIPGYVDTHMHIESSMCTPAQFARAALPFGTTTVVIDPHEIANVSGVAGVEYMLRASVGLPLRVFVTVPSSVPAVPDVETAGASFDAGDIARMLTWERVVGVAELMDYPGIVRGDARMAAITAAGLASGKTLEGHCPLLSGRALAAYCAAGVDSDHECRSAPEMVEKLRAGMWVYGRENTWRHTVGFLAEALREVPDSPHVALCSDDTDPDDLLRHGHLNRGVRVLVESGVDPARVARIAALNGATRFGLRDLGAIGAGRFADILLVERVGDTYPAVVIAGGRVVARAGQLVAEIAEPVPPPLENTVRIAAPLSEASFRLRVPGAGGDVSLPCIAVDANRTTTLGTVALRVAGGIVQTPPPDGVLLLAVVPRHGQAHPPALAPMRNVHLRDMHDGAMATTVAHDSHNLIVAGRTPADMLLAARAVAEMGGGVALVSGGRVVATVRLPIAGLMSASPIEEIAAEVRAFNERARAAGIGGASPVLALSGLALPVAPFVRLTDRGLVDTLTQRFVPLVPH